MKFKNSSKAQGNSGKNDLIRLSEEKGEVPLSKFYKSFTNPFNPASDAVTRNEAPAGLVSSETNNKRLSRLSHPLTAKDTNDTKTCRSPISTNLISDHKETVLHVLSKSREEAKYSIKDISEIVKSQRRFEQESELLKQYQSLVNDTYNIK